MAASGADFQVVIIGADARARAHCRRRLTAHQPVWVLAECDTVDDLTRLALPQHAHGVVILTGAYTGPTGDLTAHLRDIRHAVPAMPVMVVSQPPPVMHAHIAGWLSFGSPVDLAAAVSVVASGGWIGDRVAPLAAGRSGQPQLTLVARQEAAQSMPVPFTHLTARENQVLVLLARGMTNPDIAAMLHITPDTVKSHVRHIMQKLHVSDRTQAAVVAVRAKIA